LPLLLVSVLVVVALLARNRGTRESTESDLGRPGESVLAAGQTVSLAIDFGDGRRAYAAQPVRDGMTVRDLLASAGGSSGGAKFAQQGSGDRALLTELNGVKNEGAGGRNWTYTVNGKFADRSFAIYKLRPGDEVLWTFAEPK
jgi:hypothetical protein